MKKGIFFPSTELPSTPGVVREFTLAVEAMGYDYILHGDHILGAPHDRNAPMWGPYNETDAWFDPFVLTAYMAAVSSTIEFATSVLILPQRQTVLAAKQAANVATLSGNRLRIGAGIGWNQVEYEALNQRFGRRGQRMDEQIELMRQLWSEAVITGRAGDETVDRAGIHPRPDRPIPIWTGGYADAALRRGARIGDGFAFAGLIDEIEPRKLALRTMLEEFDRDADQFPSELVMIPPANDGQGRWPRDRPNFLPRMDETASRWKRLGGTHIGVVTYWMELGSLDAHLDYAARALEQLCTVDSD
ncbi:TIGR03619 family F420-dependent LLM class oxidoreductase [Nocardia vinacea]|uniref:TIGR03619 family F420-dependent LLM class oxidoreductase n=1 Tax=Nocardia vinacea TaxID=96468 RepID=A0ABZ1YWW3_9NOCA|nr:TIGR03619 family F420-dependent LLM class oxidoreductase [Nocardia vinacea]